MTNPKVSVIMPAYNRADFISNAIQGILSQTFKDFELIIINDGSDDETERIVESVKDKRIRYFSQKHSGVAAARNLGLEKARGEWISFCDSDDVYFKDRLNCFLGAAKNKECLIYSGWIRFIKREADILIQNFLYGFEKEFDLDVYQFKNIFPASAVMVKKSCLEQAGKFDPALTYEEDWELFLRVSDRCPVHQLKFPTFFYQVGSLDDPRKKHHLLENREKARSYIAGKRVKELLGLYSQSKDSAIAKKIFLASQNLDNIAQKKEIFLQLQSFQEFIGVNELIKKDLTGGFDALKNMHDDQLISHLIKKMLLNFSVPKDIFERAELGKVEQALLSFFEE